MRAGRLSHCSPMVSSNHGTRYPTRPLRARRVRLAFALVAAATPACGPQVEPPGRSAARPESDRLARPAASVSAPETRPASETDTGLEQALRDEAEARFARRERTEPGRGAKIASIAVRTWVYVAPHDKSAKLGYLRAGAIVDRGDEPVSSGTCAGGWYRVAPRGYVCVGKGASLALDHPVVLAATRGPARGEATPYAYVLSRSPGPHLYFKLPTEVDQKRVEGDRFERGRALGAAAIPGVPVDAPPGPLASGEHLPKPYGADTRLAYSVHRGRASDKSAFGLVTAFDWTGRVFGLTTELDLIPLDRTKPGRISAMKGAHAAAGGIPAIVIREGATRMRKVATGALERGPALHRRTGVVLTGKVDDRIAGMREIEGGDYIHESHLAIAQHAEDPAGYARAGRKWISVSIKKQLLVAFEGKQPVYATLVSTGRDMLADPETTSATVRGVFSIKSKHVSATMDGEEGSDDFELHDVPYVQYFFGNYALHGAYWHDEFGKARSHGCVNLAPADAAWLFEWTDPQVPKDWHAAIAPEGGTLVWIHP